MVYLLEGELLDFYHNGHFVFGGNAFISSLATHSLQQCVETVAQLIDLHRENIIGMDFGQSACRVITTKETYHGKIFARQLHIQMEVAVMFFEYRLLLFLVVTQTGYERNISCLCFVAF